MSDLDRLIQLLAKLPGLGPRSARRAALFLLKRREALMEPLGIALRETALHIHPCSVCGNLDTTDPCALCRDPRRDSELLCVVEEVADLWAIERSGAFKGRYHVLGGALSPLDGIGREQLRLQELLDRVKEGAIKEAIVCTNPTIEGEATAMLVARELAPLGVTVSRLASGLPVGGDLEYADELTLGRAIEGRRALEV